MKVPICEVQHLIMEPKKKVISIKHSCKLVLHRITVLIILKNSLKNNCGRVFLRSCKGTTEFTKRASLSRLFSWEDTKNLKMAESF